MILFYNPKATRPRNRRLPLSILAIAATVEGKEEYAIVDGNLDAHPTDSLIAMIRERPVEVLAVTVMPGPQTVGAVASCREIRARFPDLPIVWGGYFASNYTSAALKLAAGGILSAVGIDSSAAMLKCAAAKTRIEGRLVMASSQKLPFPAAVFDLALCSFALGHVRDLTGMLRELARVTKSGANIFVSDLHPEACAEVGVSDFATEIEMIPRSAEEFVQAFFFTDLRL